jgi:hypothetical protein
MMNYFNSFLMQRVLKKKHIQNQTHTHTHVRAWNTLIFS